MRSSFCVVNNSCNYHIYYIRITARSRGWWDRRQTSARSETSVCVIGGTTICSLSNYSLEWKVKSLTWDHGNSLTLHENGLIIGRILFFNSWFGNLVMVVLVLYRFSKNFGLVTVILSFPFFAHLGDGLVASFLWSLYNQCECLVEKSAFLSVSMFLSCTLLGTRLKPAGDAYSISLCRQEDVW